MKFSIYLNRRVFVMIEIPVSNANSIDPDQMPILSLVHVNFSHINSRKMRKYFNGIKNK